MVNFFIERWRFSSVIAIIFVLAGGVCAFLLPIAQYPDITPPQVVVTASYPGASADIVAKTVTTPIEEQVNGVQGMEYMSSVSANDGSSTITVTFSVGYNLDIAAVDVQNRVDRATPQLPDIVTKGGVVTQKKQPNITLLVMLTSPNGSHDQVFLSNYANIQIVDVLKRLPGVGDIVILGPKIYAMRVWLDPERLAKLGITATDVQQTVLEQNQQVAAGTLGQAPTGPDQVFQFQINALGRLEAVEQFEDIIVRTGADGSLVRLRDVGRVELGAQLYSSNAGLNGKPASALGVYQLPGSNAFAMAQRVRAEMERLSKRFPPDVAYSVNYDTTVFVSESIKEVAITLLQAIGLVVVVVFVFLQGWRTTVVPAITIPVSLIGTLAVMQAIGFSLNTISLLGLVLAIGLVVDDAIVVVENVERQLETGKPPLEAAKVAMAEVTGPIVATTAVLMAVFVPVAFMPGLTGQLYKQFALTIAISVGISAINSLSLSPALCAVLLRKQEPSRFPPFVWFNRGFDRAADAYKNGVAGLVVWRWALMLAFAGLAAACALLFVRLPTAFVPSEGQGYFIVNVAAPDGSALGRTDAVVNRVRDQLKAAPGIRDVIAISGFNLITGANQSSAGVVFAVLHPWAERTTPELSATGIIASVQKGFAAIPDAAVNAFNAPAIPGLGTTGGFEFQLQDLAGLGAQPLNDTTQAFLKAARQQPELTGLFTTYSTGVPQLYLDVNRQKAKLAGVALGDVFTSLQIYLGSLYVNDFNIFGRVNRVILQAEADSRRKERDLSRLYVRNAGGGMVPLSTLASFRPMVGPETVPHYNLYGAALINGSPAPGYSTGQAQAAMERVAAQVLPSGAGFEWTGVIYQQIKAGSAAPFIFALALVFVFLFLAAQYESWAMPVMVMLAIPLALLGAMAALTLRGFTLDVYGQIGLVMLIGLAAKNAILIVEFAKESRDRGMGMVEAAQEAARLRLRPILMTAFAFILGVFPLVVAGGAGAASRQSLGTTVCGGMLLATVLSLVFVPVFYVVIQRMREGSQPEPRTPTEGSGAVQPQAAE